MNNGVFIPIEIMRREYISKLLLSIELIKKGMPVIIGHKGPVLKLALKAKEPGVLFYKSTMAGGMEKTSDILRNNGFCIVAQDEEAGIIFENFRDFYLLRDSLQHINTVDLFFTWGKDEYTFLSERFNSNKKIVHNFGALRSCFWGNFGKQYYKNEVKNLQSEFGDYVLIVSNLAVYNSYLGEDEFHNHLKQYTTYDKNYYQKLFEIEKKIFTQYVKLVKVLSDKLGKSVIIRPHPVEGTIKWENEFQDFDNVFIKKNGELLPWILGSEFIIQNNCTSAIEASAANIPVMTYADDDSDITCLSDGKENIPNKLSINIFGEDAFIRVVKNINHEWNKEENKIKREEFLKRKLKDFGTTKPAENIAKKILDFVGQPNPSGNINLGKDSILYDIYEKYRLSKFRPKTTAAIFDINKRETLSYRKIQKDILDLFSLMNIDENINLKRVGRNSYYLFPLGSKW